MKRGRNQRRRQGMNINRALDSNGPDVRIRGTANQIYDKYLALARDATSSGDRVKAENYLQHAEHYFRLIRSIQPAQAPGDAMDGDGDQPSFGEGAEPRPRRREPEGETAQGRDETGEQQAREPRVNGGDAESGADGDRRRRRRPRRAPRADDAGADEDVGEEETVEAAVS